MPYSLRLIPNVLAAGEVATVRAEFFERLDEPCVLKLVEVDEQGQGAEEVAAFDVTVRREGKKKDGVLRFQAAARKGAPAEAPAGAPLLKLKFEGLEDEHAVAITKPRTSAEGRYFELSLAVVDGAGGQLFPAGGSAPFTRLDCGELEVVELALPADGLGAGARLMLEPAGGGSPTTLEAEARQPGDALVTFRATLSDLPAAASWSVKLEDGGRTTLLLDGVDLKGLAEAPAQGQPGGGQRLAVSARDDEGVAVALTAGRLASLPAATKLALAKADGALGPLAVDLSAAPAGDYRLAIDPATGPEVSFLARVAVEQDGARTLALVDPPPGCHVLRARGGLPSEWRRVEQVAVLRPYALRALMIPCFSDVVDNSDGKNAVHYAKQLRQRYAGQGWAETTILPAASWDVVVEHLEATAKAGTPYARVVTIGHGGWDGPILDGGQWSRFYNDDLLTGLCDALRRATTPFAQLYVSNCHGGGSNKFEAPEWEKKKKDHAPVFAKAKADLEAAKKAAADAPGDAQRQTALEEAQARYDVEEYEEKSIDNMLYRWCDDVARRSGRFAAGPMGITSNGYTVEHAVAVFEGEGKTRQEVWVTDVLERVVRVIPASGTLATAKVSPMTP